MNDKTLLLIGAAGLGFLWFKSRATQQTHFAPGGPSNTLIPRPSITQSTAPVNNSAYVLTPQPTGGFTVADINNPTTSAGDVFLPQAPVPQRSQISNVFILPWGEYRPDVIAPGTVHAYTWVSPDLNAHPLIMFKPTIQALPSDYTGAQGFEVSLSLTPGDFDSAIGRQADPTGSGKPFYVGDTNVYPWCTPIASNTSYYFNIRPIPQNLGLEVWTE